MVTWCKLSNRKYAKMRGSILQAKMGSQLSDIKLFGGGKENLGEQFCGFLAKLLGLSSQHKFKRQRGKKTMRTFFVTPGSRKACYLKALVHHMGKNGVSARHTDRIHIPIMMTRFAPRSCSARSNRASTPPQVRHTSHRWAIFG